MKIGNASNSKPELAHEGTCKVYALLPRSDFKELNTRFIEEFEVTGKLDPHKHNWEEFYYVLLGKGTMQIDDEVMAVKPGDLIFIPPNAVHSIAASGDRIRSVTIAVAPREQH